MPKSIIHRPSGPRSIRNRHLTIVTKTIIVLTTSVTIGIVLAILGVATWGTVLIIATGGALFLIWGQYCTTRVDRNTETLRDTYWATKDNTRDIGRLTDVAARQRQLIERAMFLGPDELDRTRPNQVAEGTGPQRIQGI
jgi:hypothetical protein